MGRGARQDQALKFSSPFRGRSNQSAPPREYGQRRYRYRLDRGNGKLDYDPGPLARVRETAKVFVAPNGSGNWQIVQETAMKDRRGRLFWDEEIVASYGADMYSRNYIENLTEKINDKPLGESIEEQVIDGQRYVKIVNRRPQHTSQPWKGEHKLAEDKPFMEITSTMEKIKPGKEEEAYRKIEEEFKQIKGWELDRRQRELDRS